MVSLFLVASPLPSFLSLAASKSRRALHSKAPHKLCWDFFHQTLGEMICLFHHPLSFPSLAHMGKAWERLWSIMPDSQHPKGCKSHVSTRPQWFWHLHNVVVDYLTHIVPNCLITVLEMSGLFNHIAEMSVLVLLVLTVWSSCASDTTELWTTSGNWWEDNSMCLHNLLTELGGGHYLE